MIPDPLPHYVGLKHHAKVHGFRIGTAIFAWVLIVVAFYYRPDLIKRRSAWEPV